MENTTSTADLQAQNIQLNARVGELENIVAELSALVEHFRELFKLSQIKRFGASSEKGVVGAEQLSLAGNPVPPAEPSLLSAAASAAVASVTEESDGAGVKHKGRKRVGKRGDDLSKLTLEVVEHNIPEGEHDCPEGYKITEIGVDIRDEIVVLPAKVIHRQHRVKVYKYEPIDDIYGETIIVKAPMPEPIIKGSAASPSLVAHIMTQKYLMHLPFYRQEQDFLRQGVFINRQNMANWSIQVCDDWLSPVYERMKQRLLEHDVAHADDTTLQVLREPGKTAKSLKRFSQVSEKRTGSAKSYMSIYRTSGESGTPVAIYEYQASHEAVHPKNFFGDWRGFLHTDGYAGYHDLPNVTVVGFIIFAPRKRASRADIFRCLLGASSPKI